MSVEVREGFLKECKFRKLNRILPDIEGYGMCRCSGDVKNLKQHDKGGEL